MAIAFEAIASGTLVSVCGAPGASATTAPAGSWANNNRMLVSKNDRMESPAWTWRWLSLLMNAPPSDEEIYTSDQSLYQALVQDIY
jgi:hypothetical protein